MQGNPRQSWILDSRYWSPDSCLWKLDPRFQSPGFRIPEAKVDLHHHKSGQPKNSFASRTGSKQKQLNHNDADRNGKHKHKHKIRQTGAKVLNFDDTCVGAKKLKRGIQSKIR